MELEESGSASNLSNVVKTDIVGYPVSNLSRRQKKVGR